MNENLVLLELQFTQEQFPDIDIYGDWQIDFDTACAIYITLEAGQKYNGSVSRKVDEQRVIFAGLESFVGEDFIPVQELSAQQIAELQLEERDENGDIIQEAGTFRQNLSTYMQEARTAREQTVDDEKPEVREAWRNIKRMSNPDNQPLFSNLQTANSEIMGMAQSIEVIIKYIYGNVEDLQL